MKLKKGDTVVVISGKDKGAEGEIIRVMPKENKVIVHEVLGGRGSAVAATSTVNVAKLGTS